jgi:hypothetical protein
MATHRFIKVPYVMQATRFLDVPDLPRLLIKDRPIPHVKHQLRASSSQNLPHNLAIDKAQFQEKIMNIELGNSIFQLEGSGPDSLIERTFPDNVVPFNLKELLDTKILQFPKLVSDGFVDATFYLMLIQALASGIHRLLHQRRLHSKPISILHLWVTRTEWPSG